MSRVAPVIHGRHIRTLCAGVPCLRRACAIDGTLEASDERIVETSHDDGDGWVQTSSRAVNHHDDGAVVDITDLDETENPVSLKNGGNNSDDGAVDIDDVPDLDDLVIKDEDDEEDDDSVLVSRYGGSSKPVVNVASGGSILRTRTYDLCITYDKYYQTPRFWLVGYDEEKRPLPPKAVYDDVSAEHAKKTITVDAHPYFELQAANIHPCKHAETMKRLSEIMLRSGKEVNPETYLVLFMKFIASVIPTIEYDYTMSA